jgi:hypothetical protein
MPGAVPSDLQKGIGVDILGRPSELVPQGSGKLNELAQASADVPGNILIGAGKSAVEGALGATRVVNKALRLPRFIPGMAQKVDNWIPEMGKPDDFVKVVTGDPNATLEREGIAQNIGGIAETIGEFMIGEGELKALSWGDRMDKIANAISLFKKYPALPRIIANSMRATAIVGAQDVAHTGGEDWEGSVKKALLAGGFTAGIETAATAATPAVKKVFDLLNLGGKAQEVASDAAAAEARLQKAVADRRNLEQISESFAARLTTAAKKQGEDKGLLSGQALAKALQEDLDAVHNQLTSNYGNALDAMSAHADAMGIQVGGPNSALAKKAKELLSEGSGLPDELQEAMKGAVPGLEPAQAILEQLKKGEPMTWEEATNLQRVLGKKAYSITDFGNPLKQVYSQLKTAVQDSFAKAADAADQPRLAQTLRDLRSDYADTMTKLEDNAVIHALRSKDFDGVSKVLLSRNTVGDNVETLRGLLDRIGSSRLEDVQHEIFSGILNKAIDASGDVDFHKMAAEFLKYPSDVRQAIWGDSMSLVDQAMRAGEKLTSDAAKSVDVLQADSQAADRLAARAKDAAAEARRILPMFVAHGPSGLAAATGIVKGVWDLPDNPNKGLREIGYGIASAAALEGGTAILRNPQFQSFILSTLQFLSNASANVGTRITEDAETPMARLTKTLNDQALRRSVFRAYGSGPEIPGMAGNIGGEAEEANAAQRGLSSETKVKPAFPKERTTGRPPMNIGSAKIVSQGGKNGQAVPHPNAHLGNLWNRINREAKRS